MSSANRCSRPRGGRREQPRVRLPERNACASGYNRGRGVAAGARSRVQKRRTSVGFGSRFATGLRRLEVRLFRPVTLAYTRLGAFGYFPLLVLVWPYVRSFVRSFVCYSRASSKFAVRQVSCTFSTHVSRLRSHPVEHPVDGAYVIEIS